MAARKAVPAATWAQAQNMYADRAVDLTDIAKLVGLAPIQLALAAKARGWPPRPPRARRTGTVKQAAPKSPKPATAAAKTSSKPPSNTPSTPSPKPTALLQQVYKTIEGELRKLDDHTGKSSQDRERASRALSQMVNSLEKAIDMQREMTKRTAKGRNAKDKQELAHAEDLRRAIAERLDRLNGQRNAGKRSATSD